MKQISIYISLMFVKIQKCIKIRIRLGITNFKIVINEKSTI